MRPAQMKQRTHCTKPVSINMQIEKTTPAVWYCITCTAPVTVSAELNGLPVILVSLDQEGQATFCAPTREVTVETDGTYSVLPTEAPGGQPFGGYVNRNLTIGHGAADAVKAVCTLTLGDLATGGSLTDSNGQSVELAAPHAYAEGYLEFRDATEACTLSIGEWSMTWEEKTDAKASGTFYIMPDEETIPVTNGEEEYPVQVPDDPTSVAGWNQSFTAAGCGIVCTATDPHGEIDVSVEAAEVGEDGNGIEIAVGSREPVTLAGGSTARTKQDVVDALNGGADCPVHASLDADEEAISLTAKVYGVNDAINATGDMFSNWSGMSGGHGDYTVAELATAIEGGFSDITPAAGETEGTITLTANDAGAAANAITYTASGCFGSGTVKQGSATRGKNAVAQTDHEVIVNGNQPRPLTPATAMKNGGVYTVAAAGAALDFSAISLAENATAEIWVDVGAETSIEWPGFYWVGTDSPDAPPDMSAVGRYRLELHNEGAVTYARLRLFTPNFGAFRALQYLQTDGTAYIDTGMRSLDRHVFAGEFSTHERPATFMGCGTDAPGAFSANTYNYQTSGASSWNYGDNSVYTYRVSNMNFDSDVKFSFRFEPSRAVVNGNEYAAVDRTSYEPVPESALRPTFELPLDKRLTLFAANGENIISGTRCYGFRVFRADGTAQLCLVPALDADGVPCMYDVVSGTPFHNAAESGEFTYA